MTLRILDLADGPARLRVALDQLIIERDAQDAVSTPLDEIGVLILAHPHVTCTQAVLAGLLARNGAAIVCDELRHPAGLLLPLVGHSTQAERIAAQAAAPRPKRKRLWQQLVRCKIAAQADLLVTTRGEDYGLRALARRVRSGDPDNLEAQAAQRYWPVLFGDSQFRRRRDAPDQNRMLNYGYAVLRAIVARALVAAGLHPSLGLQHHNRYDAFVLADDLMEPYRPLVDAAVLACVATHGADAALDRAVKTTLLTPLLGAYRSGDEARSLFDWVAHTTVSLAQVFMGEAAALQCPAGLRVEESACAGE